MSVIEWLLNSDPAIRWQVMSDLSLAPAAEVAVEPRQDRHTWLGRCTSRGSIRGWHLAWRTPLSRMAHPAHLIIVARHGARTGQ